MSTALDEGLPGIGLSAEDLAPLRAAGATSKAWPFEEARKILKRVEGAKTPPREVLFETGYGPSGLPHIGTFGEVARTTMVRNAFALMSDLPTRLICFSDDMDGFRKVPTNIPQQEMMAGYLEKPLTEVPDPFGTHDSFGAHNNARLCAFLDQFAFEYEFYSSTEVYRSGRFDETLLEMLRVYDDVMAIILPTLGAERQKTYSPFLPICPRTGRVLQVPMIARDVAAGTVSYRDPETDEIVETPVTGGRVKCQWKADWALRWAALGVTYEMSGKDLDESVKLSARICKALGVQPPLGLSYELFLDEKGEKISKSKGNGLTIDEWLTYASPESLSLYMFQKPKTAKKLYFDVIPKTVDEYLSHAAKLEDLRAAERTPEAADQMLTNPAFHIHGAGVPGKTSPVSFALLLNLVSASNASDADTLWGFIGRYAPGASAQSHPYLDDLVGYALAYYRDFVEPKKVFRTADDDERAALRALDAALAEAPDGASGEELQTIVFSVGKAHNYENLRDWFKTIYEVLLGQSQGPRFGSFIELFGVDNTRALIRAALERD